MYDDRKDWGHQSPFGRIITRSCYIYVGH